MGGGKALAVSMQHWAGPVGMLVGYASSLMGVAEVIRDSFF